MSEDIILNADVVPDEVVAEVIPAELPYTVIRDEPQRGGQVVQDNSSGSVYFLPYPVV